MANDSTIESPETEVVNPEGPVQKTTRRRVLRTAAAAAGALTAATYVKPSLTSLGISSAVAQTQPGNPPLGVDDEDGTKCSIAVTRFTAVTDFDANIIRGEIAYRNTSGPAGSPSAECGPCQISFWQITVQTGNPPGGCGGDLVTNVVAQKNSQQPGVLNTGGANPLSIGHTTTVCQQESVVFTYEIPYLVADQQFRVTLNLDVVPSPQHPNNNALSPFKACATTANP
jgi:hypothetical protein